MKNISTKNIHLVSVESLEGVRRIFGPKKDDVTREWRRIHTEELYALYSTPNIIRIIKSRNLR